MENGHIGLSTELALPHVERELSPEPDTAPIQHLYMVELIVSEMLLSLWTVMATHSTAQVSYVIGKITLTCLNQSRFTDGSAYIWS